MLLKDKVAIVTGSTRGIGKEIACDFAREGAKIVVTGTNEEKLKLTSEEIASMGCEVLCVKADVSSFEQAKNLVETTISKFGRVDILVNNAGITRDNLIARLTEEDWDIVLAVNLKGVFNCSKAVTRIMMKQRIGKIINITSVVGVTGNAGQSNYAASKAGMIGFSKSLAKELASRNITVNCVAPGFIETEMTSELANTEALLNSIPLKRTGKTIEIAKLVTFLASENADYITGEVIHVDGGMAM
ncbi:3-oxoacyl-[acyl-carrier-protein] reductase [bacterium]|nr:3-oxoacyl-[acyl-carrier-protein] reductase [bacterium]